MKRKLVLGIMFVCGVSIAATAASIKSTPFAESVATLRAEATKYAGYKSQTTSYQLDGGAAPKSMSVNLKSGEEVVIYCASSVNTAGNSYWIINDAEFNTNGKKSDLTQQNVSVMGAAKFRFVNKNQRVQYNGEALTNGIQMPMAASMLISACEAKSVTFELMLNGDTNSEATIKIQKVNKAKVASVESAYPEESAIYKSFGKGSMSLLIYEPDCAAERSMTFTAIKRIGKNEAFMTALKEADALKSAKEKSVAYISLLERAVKVASLEEQLSWLKSESVDAAIERLKGVEGYDVATNEARAKELKALVAAGFDGIYDLTNCEGIASAERALDLHKQIILANPAFEFDKILVGRYNIPYGSRTCNASQMGTQPNNWSNQTSAKRGGFDAEIGVFSNLKGDMKYETIYKPTWDTSVPDIRLNWDANRILFTMNPEGDHHWQVYEYDMEAKELDKITDGSDEHLDYFDANYLPSGKLAVVSNVGGQGVPCVNGTDQVGNLCLFDPETKDMRRLTFDQDANWGPVMMHNGKLMYQRWEYTDLMHYYSRFVMSMNPDGTEQKALFGSGMTFPNTNFDVQPLPNHPSRFVAIVSGHHGVARAGRLFMFDPAISRNTTDAMIHEFPFKDRELEVVVKDQLVTGVFPQFIKPFPIDNETILVTGKMKADGLWGLYLVDTDDNVVLLKEYEGEGMIHATPIRNAVAPPVIPDKIDLSKNEATVFIQDIYEGEGLPNVPRGTVTHLRIHTYEYAYNSSPSNHYAQGIQSGWDIKTCLGIVPVEEDGSVIFKIPANTPIAVQPLDKDGAALIWMRSWFVGMPGETVSCVGCHEDQNQIPAPKNVTANSRKPHEIAAPEGGIRPFQFDLEIQPMLDRACVSCHDGNGKSKLDFTGYKKDKYGYGTSCLALHPYVHRQGAEAAMIVMLPYEYHANNSRLVQILKNGHYGVELTDKEWRTLYNWIDYNVPDKGAFTTLKNHGYDQYQRRMDLSKKYGNGVYADWRKQAKDYADYLKAQPAVEPAKPNYTVPNFKNAKAKNFPTNVEKGETKMVEVAPGVEIEFVKIPAGQFVMGENRTNSNAAPEFKASVDKAFWMSTTELSNAQVRAIMPDHFSRYYDQQWKDHVVEGYEADGDDQPAIRISWEKAMDYCDKMSDKTGLKVNLPTETQWEWAARAGSDSDYWYGDANTNFATKENLADKQALKLAVARVDPKPIDKDYQWGGIKWYDYCTFLPKDESVDDGYMLPANPGSYDANGFGLHDMLGNVAEWTRSDYFPHSQKVSKGATSEYKVVKGGCWKTHPKDARVASRYQYHPWQSPYNVGLRLVIEE
ncbi:MAG: SUMF1/EgtB/PvdO family nonheme iron enzyme [Rikenellaceae bacterium]